jgi:hypothetical protein
MSQQFEEANQHDGLSGKNLSRDHQQRSGVKSRRFNLPGRSSLFQRLMTTAPSREARQFSSRKLLVSMKSGVQRRPMCSLYGKGKHESRTTHFESGKSGRSPNTCRRKSFALSIPGCAYTKVVQFGGFVGGIRILDTISKLEGCSPAT